MVPQTTNADHPVDSRTTTRTRTGGSATDHLIEARAQIQMIQSGQLHVLPEHLDEIAGDITTALEILGFPAPGRRGAGTLAYPCPLCKSEPGIPCRANYGTGEVVAWPHLERIRRARPASQPVDQRTEDRRRQDRLRVEEEWCQQLGSLDQLASFVDNVPRLIRRERLLNRAAGVLSDE